MLASDPLGFLLRLANGPIEDQAQPMQGGSLRCVAFALTDNLVVCTANMPVPKCVLLALPDLGVHFR
jgi:hypothetical protein